MDFIGTLLEMQSGRVAEEMNRHWRELLDSVMANGGAGQINISLKLKPVGTTPDGRVAQIEIEHATAIKKPRRQSGKSFFFATADGNLSRKDTRQEEIDFATSKEANRA